MKWTASDVSDLNQKCNKDFDKLTNTIITQLDWCRKCVNSNGKISQENLGRILAINQILISCYEMSWAETKELFEYYGLFTDLIDSIN